MTATSYQRFRLWSGICSIGLNLSLAWLAYGISLGFGDISFYPAPWILPLYALLISVFLILAFLPFEILIGFAAESSLGRTNESLNSWLSSWVKNQRFGILSLACGISLFGWLGPATWGATWIAAALLCFVLILIIYVLPSLIEHLGTGHISKNERLESRINEELEQLGTEPVRLRLIDDGGQEGVNGMMLPFYKNRFFINQSAADQLSAKELGLLALREQWFQNCGQTRLSLLIIITWSVAGFLLSCTVPGGVLPANTALQHGLGGMAIMTSWCFLALFVWPPLSNRAMLNADSYLAEKSSPDQVLALIQKLQKLNQSDDTLTTEKEWVFHPIPSLRKRINNIEALSLEPS
ncbi:MAG: hypothetical protein AAF558_13820 [Verrucomicrobiota bacterium]